MQANAANPSVVTGPRPLKAAPTPKGIPWLGSTLEIWRDPLKLFTGSVRELGDFVHFQFGPFDYALLNDPAHIHHVLVERQKNYAKSRNYDGLKLIMGNGLVTSEGEHWRKQRRLAQPAFHQQRLRAFTKTMATATSDMLARWESFDDAEFDLHREMMRVTLRMVGMTLFSVDVEGDAVEVGHAVDVAIRFANAYVTQGIRYPLWLPLPSNLRFRRAMRTLDALVYRLIDERRKSGFAGNDLLGMLLEATDETEVSRPKGMSDDELRNEVMTLIIAGHETTANLLTFALSLLSSHPEVASRLREEVREVLGDREPTFEDLPKLVYTEQVVQESMRLYPPAWVIEREALEDDVVGGYAIPKGTTIFIVPYALHRSPKHWTSPYVFDPDRFSDQQAKKMKAYLPFGDGPRICIGKHFAMMEAKILLSMVARRFSVLRTTEEPIELEPTVTLRPKHGVDVRLTSLVG